MADIGHWSGGAVSSTVPGTTMAAPANGLADTQVRNDGSVYTWTNSTSTLTLPSSGLADGYLSSFSLSLTTVQMDALTLLASGFRPVVLATSPLPLVVVSAEITQSTGNMFLLSL